MAAIYPIDYPFNVDREGWPEPVYAPPYPFEHYYDNGRNPRQIPPAADFRSDYDHRPDENYKVPLAIRRHTPGATDPSLQQLSSRSLPPRTTPRFTVNRYRPQPNPRSESVDPDERPIKPMSDTSVYKQPAGPKKPFQPRKTVQTKKPPPRILKPIQTSPRYEPDTFRPPPPPPSSRPPIIHAANRRPVRTDLIPRTTFGPPPRRHRPRPTIVEEYVDDDYYPVTYIKPLPRKVLPYKNISHMTAREFEDYQMPRTRRLVRIRSPPTETIIYRT